LSIYDDLRFMKISINIPSAEHEQR